MRVVAVAPPDCATEHHGVVPPGEAEQRRRELDKLNELLQVPIWPIQDALKNVFRLRVFSDPHKKRGPANKKTVTNRAAYSTRLHSAFINMPLNELLQVPIWPIAKGSP